MRNRWTFAAVIGILLENKKKTYPQHQLIRSLFSAYLDDELTAADLISDDTIMYSRWCSGARPIPLDIIRCYEEENCWGRMTEDFRNKIIPNLINETQASHLTEELVEDSIPVIGSIKAEELCSTGENAAFFPRSALRSAFPHHLLFGKPPFLC